MVLSARLKQERNKLTGDALTCLAKCPRLRELSLAHNKVTSTPTIDAMAEATNLDHTEILAELVALDLAHNQIRSDKDIDDLTVLPKLEQLSLYGNPLLGSTGEDPTGETVRTLVQTATQQRDGWPAIGENSVAATTLRAAGPGAGINTKCCAMAYCT